MLYTSPSRQVDCKLCGRDLLSLVTGLVESKQEERRWTCGKTVCRLESNVRQGESRQGAFKGVPTSNARLTRRAMFEFAAQLAPGLLMKTVMIAPRSCRGPALGGSEDGAFPGKARVDPADRSSAATENTTALLHWHSPWMICGGASSRFLSSPSPNARVSRAARFESRLPGGQWRHGAMGKAL